MFKRDTKLMLKYSRTAAVLEVLGWVLMAAVLIYSIQAYSSLGDSIATAFDSRGVPTEWKAKAAALMHPITAVFVYIVLTGIGIIVRRAVSPDEDYPILRRVLIALLCAKAEYLLYELAATYFTMSQQPAPALLKVLFVVAEFITVLLTVFSCIRCRRAK